MASVDGGRINGGVGLQTKLGLPKNGTNFEAAKSNVVQMPVTLRG
jgi:hypothetical protein